jgi:hypothetical protein
MARKEEGMNFNEVELNYILEAVRFFNDHGIPQVSPFDRAVYIAEIEGLMEKIGHHIDGEDEE